MTSRMMLVALALVSLTATSARSIQPDTCCCYVFTQETTLCPDCALKLCACDGGTCGYEEICNGYQTAVSHTEGVSLRYEQTYCKTISQCEPKYPGPCVPGVNDCMPKNTVFSGTITFPYAWEACP